MDKTKPCKEVYGNVPCGGEMTFHPRDLGFGGQASPPQWVCDTCDKIEVVDDDPGTPGMFQEDGA